MGTYYVDNTLHPAANAVGTAAGGGTDYILLQDNGVQADGEFDAYGVLITGGTGEGQQRRIISYDHTGSPNGERCAAVDSPWSVPPDAASQYEIAVGGDSNAGTGPGPGDSGAWRTIDRAMDAMAAAGLGPHHIHVKGGRAYLETATADTAGASGRPVSLEGYAAVPGDGGRAVIDGGGIRSCGINSSIGNNIYYVFRNLTVMSCTGGGFDLPIAGSLRLINCRAEGNGGSGFNVGQDNIIMGCESVGNGLNGFACQTAFSSLGTVLVHCRACGNGNNQFKGGSLILIFCEATGLPDDKYAVYASGLLDACYAINCTIDGTNAGQAAGCFAGSSHRHLIVNNIFSNLDRGVQANAEDPLRLARNNLFFNCPGGNMINVSSDGGDVEADPLYIDPAGGDVDLSPRSPALRAGCPAHVDIGCRQHPSRTVIGGPCGVGMQD